MTIMQNSISLQEPSVVYELLTPDTRGEIEFCMMVIPPKAYSCRDVYKRQGSGR